MGKADGKGGAAVSGVGSGAGSGGDQGWCFSAQDGLAWFSARFKRTSSKRHPLSANFISFLCTRLLMASTSRRTLLDLLKDRRRIRISIHTLTARSRRADIHAP
jgi:hypothetical protein